MVVYSKIPFVFRVFDAIALIRGGKKFDKLD
jgi:hypothetical protein